MNNPVSINLLQAEGELNRQIQAALQAFRTKLLNDVNTSKSINSIAQPYQSNKEGPEKIFVFRQSLLSLMFQINDFRTLYNMFFASFIILTCSILYNSYKTNGQLIDVLGLYKVFLGWHTIIVAWIVLAIIFYQIILVTKVAINTKWYIWFPLYFLHISSIMATASYFSSKQNLGFATIVIIMCEAVRMIMKSHSYLRTKLLYATQNQYSSYQIRGVSVINVAKAGLKESGKEKNDNIKKISIRYEDLFTQIKKLSYFFFCPTLIYKDQYILTPVRSFKNIITHLINFLSCTYYAYILFASQCKPIIQSLENNLNTQTLISAIINLMLPSVLFLILGFFGFLHSWLNLWSEITRFPDRAFYSDWWNCSQFGSYYRKWNIVVHDWLYYYVYLDLNRFFPSLRKIKAIPQLLTFFISAIIHEVIIYYALGFFYPILFILFTGPGIIFVQSINIKKISVNLLFWLKMYLGTSIMISLYLIEVFARIKITDQFIEQKWGFISFCIPRTLYLNKI